MTQVSTNAQTGAACWAMVEASGAGLTTPEIESLQVASVLLTTTMPPCPDQPAGAVAPAPSPEQLANEFWYTIRLPVPKPTSRPDFATTGKPTYLQTGDTNIPPSWTRATPLGTLTITAHGTYTVDWGDSSTPSGPYDNPGGPYPNGAITHTYDATGTVTIAVHEDWTATWNIGATHGTLTDLHTTGTLPGFPIGQIQAVITG